MLENKVALITGAAQGIGEGIAIEFAKDRATVIITDINDKLGLSVAGKIPNAHYLHLNVSLESDWENLTQFLKEKKLELDIVVNNAGIIGFEEGFGPADPENCSLKDWHKVHKVNADGVFLRCNSIHPAAILTPMWEPMLGTGLKREEMMKTIAEGCPLKIFGQPEDVAHAAVYLASEKSRYVTGIELNIDGGILAGSASPPKPAE